MSASQRYDAGPSKQPGQDILYVDSALAIGGIEAFVTCETKCFRAELIRGLTCVVSGEDNNSKRLGDLHKLAPAACFLLMLPWHQNRVQKHTLSPAILRVCRSEFLRYGGAESKLMEPSLQGSSP